MPACDLLPTPAGIATGKPVHLFTIRAADERTLLTMPAAVRVFRVAWRAATTAGGWAIGHYVILPGHLHFFARPHPDGDPAEIFIRNWKKWTACLLTSFAQVEPPIWQPGFVEQVLASADIYHEWRDYIVASPVRAGHAPSIGAWPHAGELEELRF